MKILGIILALFVGAVFVLVTTAFWFAEVYLVAIGVGALGAWTCYKIWPSTPVPLAERKPISLSPEQRAALKGDTIESADAGGTQHIEGEGYFDLACVGESFRIHNLLKVVGPPQPDFVELQFTATLVPESGNRYDRNAVAVYVKGLHVAYLAREAAREYRALYGTQRLTCDAEIRGSWQDKPMFGVFLDLPSLA